MCHFWERHSPMQKQVQRWCNRPLYWLIQYDSMFQWIFENDRLDPLVFVRTVFFKWLFFLTFSSSRKNSEKKSIFDILNSNPFIPRCIDKVSCSARRSHGCSHVCSPGCSPGCAVVAGEKNSWIRATARMTARARGLPSGDSMKINRFAQQATKSVSETVV